MKLATLCYIKDKDNGKTLMMHRVKKENDAHKGKWNGIGGKFADGETPEECIVREVEEETGLKIKNPKLAGRVLFPAFDKQPEDWHVYIFIADKFEGNIIDSVEGKLEWVPDDQLLNLNLWEGDRLFFKWIDDKKYFSAKLVYKGDKLINYSVVIHSFS